MDRPVSRGLDPIIVRRRDSQSTNQPNKPGIRGAMNHNHKQVIVVRRDLNMRAGKLIAQTAHAAMMFLLDGHALTKGERQWVSQGMTKICVQVPTLEELVHLDELANQLELTHHLITDSGRTEFKGIPTITCLAIGPNLAPLVDKVTGDLALY